MRLMFAARAIDRMAGGVERMIIALMNAMVDRGHQVALFTWDQAGAEAFYPMSPAISWHRLDMGDPDLRAGPGLMLRRAGAIRAVVRQHRPQAIVCFQHGPFLALRLYTLNLGIPLVVAERNAPTRFDHSREGRHRSLIFQTLRLARRIAVQLESYRELYPAFLHDRIVAIPNPVFPVAARARPDQPGADGRYHLLSVGRLGYQKNYQVLLRAFALVAPRFPGWCLTIVGEGEDRQALERLVRQYDLADRVSLPGVSADIAARYTAAQAFCLPSRWEGFPNALAEAMAHGLPSVGYAGCAGVRDLIVDGRTGLLAPGNDDGASLAEALASVMGDPAQRATMGAAASRSVSAFAPDKIFDMWQQLFAEAARR